MDHSKIRASLDGLPLERKQTAKSKPDGAKRSDLASANLRKRDCNMFLALVSEV